MQKQVKMLQLHRINETSCNPGSHAMAVNRPGQHAMEAGGEGRGLKNRYSPIADRALFAAC